MTLAISALEKIVLEAEGDATAMENAVRKANPVVKVVVGTKIYEIREGFYDVTVQDMVDRWREEVEENRLLNYLKAKYDGYQGIPYSCLKEELQVTSREMKGNIKGWVTAELGLNAYFRESELFVPFELVAGMIVDLDDED